MKTDKTTHVTFSDETVHISLPRSWSDLTQRQLRYVFFCMGTFNITTAKIYILCRFTGISIVRRCANGILCTTGDKVKPVFLILTWQMAEILKALDWLMQPNYTPVRMDSINNLQAVDSRLHGVSFMNYLKLENFYQGFIKTHKLSLLRQMFDMLYVDKDGNSDPDKEIRPWELQSVFLWYQSIKNFFSSQFPDFFSRVDSSEDIEETDMMRVMNAEVRALTGGDICKEEQVLSSDCWRALTELNEKAREAREWKEKYGRH